MKSLVLTMAILTTLAAQADNCPTGSSKLWTCTPDFKSGDHEIMTKIADKVELCEDSGVYYIQLEYQKQKSGWDETILLNKGSVGATSFAVTDTGARLVIATGARPIKKGNKIYRSAKLIAPLGDDDAHATFKCTR